MAKTEILITGREAHKLIQLAEKYAGTKLPCGRYDESTVEYWAQRFLRSEGFAIGQVRAVLSSGYRNIMAQTMEPGEGDRIRAFIGLG